MLYLFLKGGIISFQYSPFHGKSTNYTLDVLFTHFSPLLLIILKVSLSQYFWLDRRQFMKCLVIMITVFWDLCAFLLSMPYDLFCMSIAPESFHLVFWFSF